MHSARRLPIVATLAAFALVASVLFVTGCSGLRQVSREAFVQEARLEHMQSFRSTSYIGATGNSAYLEVVTPALFWGDDHVAVWWTPMSEFSEAEKKELIQGKNPWSLLYKTP